MPITSDSKQHRIIVGIENLPTPPIVYTRIDAAVADPNTSAYQIASIIAEDPAMSAKILRVSNSAFYGSRVEITSVKQAIVTIGLEAVKSVVLSASLFKSFNTGPEFASYQEDFWRHSLLVGSACRVLIRKFSNQWIQDADNAFSAGLLHDIGKLAMVCFLPEDWNKLHENRKKVIMPLYDLEKKALGYTHAEVGQALAAKWNLPKFLQDAIAWHHEPLNSPRENSLATMVYCADYVSRFSMEEDDEATQTDLQAVDMDVLNSMKIEPMNLLELKSLVIEEYSKSQVFLEIAKGL